MKIPITCAGCGKHYEVDGAHAGKKGKCASCGQRLTIPHAGPAVAAEPDSYQLDERHASEQSTSYTPARGRGGDDQPTSPRSKKKASGRSRRQASESANSRRSSLRLAVLIGLACAGLVLGILAAFVPGARLNIGRLTALAGLIVFIYGYGSGAYIAFTEDDLYGWLYLLIPPYAAYYFVTRWDEMSSRLVMIVVGLALLSGGGRLLEAGQAPNEGPPAANAE